MVCSSRNSCVGQGFHWISSSGYIQSWWKWGCSTGSQVEDRVRAEVGHWVIGSAGSTPWDDVKWPANALLLGLAYDFWILLAFGWPHQCRPQYVHHVLFFHILGIIVPTDEYFSEGLKPPNRWLYSNQRWHALDQRTNVFSGLWTWLFQIPTHQRETFANLFKRITIGLSPGSMSTFLTKEDGLNMRNTSKISYLSWE